jgi:PhnB protein
MAGYASLTRPTRWFFGTHIEDVAPAELKKRAAEAFKKQKAA